MCVIIIKHQENKSIDQNILARASAYNPHGLGIVWLDTYDVSYHESTDWRLLQTDRPFIAHCRYATVGKVCKENVHPFPCGDNKDELLMQNGTIKGHGYGSKDVTDTQDLADHLCMIKRAHWSKHLAKFDCRFVTINTKHKSYQMYNREDWVKQDGVWYSKENILTKMVAVYGTLKQGKSNHRLLKGVPFIGAGKTKDKYPMVVRGLPYLYDEKGVGHNVNVEVYECDGVDMNALDSLEGHPTFYERRKTDIVLDDGEVMNVWIYFINERFSLLPEETKNNLKQSYEGSDWGTWSNRFNTQSHESNAKKFYKSDEDESFKSDFLDEWDDWNSIQEAKDSLQKQLTKSKRTLQELKSDINGYTQREYAHDNLCPTCGCQCAVDEFEGLAYCAPCEEMYYADIEFSF